ncbi:MAG TPA: NHL repeat-containing protein [Opitutaceae bacterium]
MLLASLSQRARAQSDYATPYTFGDYAGSGVAGSADGTGTAASFNQPFGVALDSAGNLYVADKNNHTIRVVSSGGAVTTLAGTAGALGMTDGTGSDARFNFPVAVAVSSAGDVYVADSNNNTVRKVTPKGVVTTFAGTAGTAGNLDSSTGAANLRSPYGLAVDSSGNVYVADQGNNNIRKIASAGAVSTLAGPVGVATTADENGAAAPVGSADGTGPAASFNQPTGIAVDSAGNVYVADTGNDTIRKVTSAGVVTTLAGSPGAVGSTDGTGSAARFNAPSGLAVDGSGNIYVADAGNSTIRKVTSAGVVTTLAGLPLNFANVPGTGSAAIFDVPEGVAVDGSGTLFISQKLGELISKGSVSTAPPPPVTPVFTVQPLSVSVTGGPVVLDVAATGATSYQWKLNGVAVNGATAPTIALDPVSALTEGTYTCVASNSSGSATSSAATVALVTTSNAGHLANISARAQVGTGANIIFGCFAISGGASGGTLPILVRASGPALVSFNVAGTLADPQLQLFSSAGAVLDTNNAWGGATAISTTATDVGAFTWTNASSHDSALDLSLGGGTYTAQVAGQSGDTGVALVEVYDASVQGSFDPTQPHLENLSARVDVGTGANVLEAGFVIKGNSALTVLIRASGPAIAASPFNVSGTLADPQLTLQNPGTGVIYAQNTGWGADSNISLAAATVGAFSWGTAATKDSAILITLPPGSYTAGVQGASGDSGVALVEVYELYNDFDVGVPASKSAGNLGTR